MRWECRLDDGQSYCGHSTWPLLAATAMYAVIGLVKFTIALLMCSCGNSSQMVCKATFNSSVILGFGHYRHYGTGCPSSRPSVHPLSVQPLSVNIYFTRWDISILSRRILTKLGTDIHHVSGNCWKGWQGQRWEVEVTARWNALLQQRKTCRLTASHLLSMQWRHTDW